MSFYNFFEGIRLLFVIASQNIYWGCLYIGLSSPCALTYISLYALLYNRPLEKYLQQDYIPPLISLTLGQQNWWKNNWKC